MRFFLAAMMCFLWQDFAVGFAFMFLGFASMMDENES